MEKKQLPTFDEIAKLNTKPGGRREAYNIARNLGIKVLSTNKPGTTVGYYTNAIADFVQQELAKEIPKSEEQILLETRSRQELHKMALNLGIKIINGEEVKGRMGNLTKKEYAIAIVKAKVAQSHEIDFNDVDDLVSAHSREELHQMARDMGIVKIKGEKLGKWMGELTSRDYATAIVELQSHLRRERRNKELPPGQLFLRTEYKDVETCHDDLDRITNSRLSDIKIAELTILYAVLYASDSKDDDSYVGNELNSIISYYFQRNTTHFIGRVVRLSSSTDPNLVKFITLTANCIAQICNHLLKTNVSSTWSDATIEIIFILKKLTYDQVEIMDLVEKTKNGDNLETKAKFYPYVYSFNSRVAAICAAYGELNLSHFQIYSEADYTNFNTMIKNQNKEGYIQSVDYTHYPCFGTPMDMTMPCMCYALFIAGLEHDLVCLLYDKFGSNIRAQRKRVFADILNEPGFENYAIELTLFDTDDQGNQTRRIRTYPESLGKSKDKSKKILKVGVCDDHYFAVKQVMHIKLDQENAMQTPYNSTFFTEQALNLPEKTVIVNYKRKIKQWVVAKEGDKPKPKYYGEPNVDSFDFVSNHIINKPFCRKPMTLTTKEDSELFGTMLTGDYYRKGVDVKTSAINESFAMRINQNVKRDVELMNKVMKIDPTWLQKVRDAKLMKVPDDVDSKVISPYIVIWVADTETNKISAANGGIPQGSAANGGIPQGSDDEHVNIESEEKPYQFSVVQMILERNGNYLPIHKKMSDLGKGYELVVDDDGKPKYTGKDAEKHYVKDQFRKATERLIYTGSDAAEKFAMAAHQVKPEIIYFHNMKFDITPLLQALIAQDSGRYDICKKEGALYSITLPYTKIYDSYKMIPMKLEKFADAFGLVSEKEFMNYSWFDKLKGSSDGKTFEKLWVDPVKEQDYYGSIKAEAMPAESLKVATDNGWINSEGKLDALAYSAYYCGLDTEVLAMGLLKFSETVQEHLGLNIFNHLTVSSLADSVLKAYGCYEDVHQVSGICCKFISSCVRGGFCSTARGKKYDIKRFIVDLDATSLYPSAMRRMPGFPIGPPQQLTGHQLSYHFLNSSPMIAAWLEVSFKKVICEDPFNYLPICTRKDDKEGKVIYECKEGTLYRMTLVDLQELIKYGCVLPDDVIVHCGYYSDLGFNPKVQEAIQKEFDLRAQLKSAHNPCEQVIKGILNSSYGKSIMKASHYKYEFIDSERKDAIIRHTDSSMESMEKMGRSASGSDIFLLKSFQNALEHSNYGTVGTYVLSYSKVIMNEAHYILHKAAKEIGLSDDIPTVFYRDTDSLQFLKILYEPFVRIFRETYGREIIGKALGQFKIDYEIESKANKTIVVDYKKETGLNLDDYRVSYASHTRYLPRKVYMSEITHELTIPVDCPKLGYTKGQVLTLKDYHIRHKGIPNNTIEHGAFESMDTLKEGKLMTSAESVYDRLLSGETVIFDLAHTKPCFDIKLGRGIFAKNHFLRASQFDGPVVSITEDNIIIYNKL